MPFMSWIPGGPVPYFVSGTIAPGAGIGVNGAAFTVTPPAGYSWLEIFHIGISNAGVGAETITMTCTGTLADGTQASNNNTYTSNVGDMDNQHFLEPAAGAGAGAGLSIFGTGKRCVSVSMVEQSTLGTSAASATVRVWAMAW